MFAMDLLSIENKQFVFVIGCQSDQHDGVSFCSAKGGKHNLNLLLSSSFSLLEHDGGTLSGTCGVI